MLFHVGAFWRLNELALLPKLARISSVSGGSITAGVLGHHWSQLAFVFRGLASASFVSLDQLTDWPVRPICWLAQ